MVLISYLCASYLQACPLFMLNLKPWASACLTLHEYSLVFSDFGGRGPDLLPVGIADRTFASLRSLWKRGGVQSAEIWDLQEKETWEERCALHMMPQTGKNSLLFSTMSRSSSSLRMSGSLCNFQRRG